MHIKVVGVLLGLFRGAMGCTPKDAGPAEPSYAFSTKLEGVSMEEALDKVEVTRSSRCKRPSSFNR
jgi:hypothetical protein